MVHSFLTESARFGFGELSLSVWPLGSYLCFTSSFENNNRVTAWTTFVWAVLLKEFWLEWDTNNIFLYHYDWFILERVGHHMYGHWLLVRNLKWFGLPHRKLYVKWELKPAILDHVLKFYVDHHSIMCKDV